MAFGQSRVERLVLPLDPRDHVQGPPDAPATLIEYGDYECPYCGLAHRIVKEVQRHLGLGLRVAYRHFPLFELHPHALAAAEAAEAAGAQGKFWEMHDVLFESQQALAPPDLVRYAEDVGLDMKRFVNELAAHIHEKTMWDDFIGGVRSGVSGTPTFFTDGVRHVGPWDADSLIEALSAEARAHGRAHG